MRRLLPVLPLLALVLSGCYETRAPMVTEGVRPDGIRDGCWRGFRLDLAAQDGTGQLREADRLVWLGPL